MGKRKHFAATYLWYLIWGWHLKWTAIFPFIRIVRSPPQFIHFVHIFVRILWKKKSDIEATFIMCIQNIKRRNEQTDNNAERKQWQNGKDEWSSWNAGFDRCCASCASSPRGSEIFARDRLREEWLRSKTMCVLWRASGERLPCTRIRYHTQNFQFANIIIIRRCLFSAFEQNFPATNSDDSRNLAMSSLHTVRRRTRNRRIAPKDFLFTSFSATTTISVYS